MAAGTAILESLNEAQRKAVSSDAATVAILAGPGSGKTHTLTSRVVYLVDTIGHRPQDVIVATFTVKAAREMSERIGKALGNGREKKLVLGTFHSIARRYLATYGQRIGLDQKFGIADDTDSRAAIARICQRLQLAVDPHMARAWISKRKAQGTDPDLLTDKSKAAKLTHARDLETCYNEYQLHLERSKLLDYDDLLVRCVELLRKHPSCVSNIQAVLIDEYQDTNGVQYELMKLFAQKERRITIVGDPDQSIYGWRSAEIRNLWRLLRDFPGTHEVALEENYRSSRSILDTALSVIQQDSKRYQKVLRPIHRQGTRPVLRRLKTSAKEAEWIVSEIRRALLMSGNMMTHNDIAILLRSAFLSRNIEHALGRAGIAYKMVGGFKFYERTEIKILLDYLKVIHQPDNNDALARIINVPKRGVGEATVKRLLEEAEKSSLSMWTLLGKHCRGERQAQSKISKQAEQKISGELLQIIKGTKKRIDAIALGTPFALVDVIEHLLERLNFQRFLKDTYSEDHEQRWANVQEFISLAGDFVQELNQAGDDALPEIAGVEQANDPDVLSKFLANVSLASDVQKDDQNQQSKPLVTISTIHAAKGLEWPIVFIPSAYDGSIPHARSDDSDEERRLLYVAMTRAQSLLYLSYPVYKSSQGLGEKQELSPFLSVQKSIFAKTGPCFDRPVMDSIARLLRRELPPDGEIFKLLPAMAPLEDNLFSEDPEVDEENSRFEEDYRFRGEYGSRAGGNSNRSRHNQPSKRQKLSGTMNGSTAPDVPMWAKECATTMEQASHFTMSSLPGFVSAGEHQIALSTTSSAAKRPADMQKNLRHSTTRRPADQKSIIGFVQTTSTKVSLPKVSTTRRAAENARPSLHTAPSANTAQLPRPEFSIPGLSKPNNATVDARKSWQCAPSPNPVLTSHPAIAPELSSHRIGAAQMQSRPIPLKQRDDNTARNYPCFSSSPVKAVTVELHIGATTTVIRPDEENEPPEEPRQAAATFHATTCNMPQGLGSGFRRPVGLGREGIAPLDKLRKPFKPLTMKRS